MKDSEMDTEEIEAWKSNEVFPEDTQNRIRKSLSIIQKKIDSLDLEISAKRSTGQIPSNELLADLAKKKEKLEVLRGAISPLKKIPREILCEFFLHSKDSMSPLLIPPRQSLARAFPWTLIQVCSHWRDVLWGIPSVWENIRIRDDVYDSEIPAVISFFRKIMARTATQISLTAPQNERLFTNLIIPSITRLKELETIVDQDSFQTLFELPAGAVDSLASIDFHLDGDDFPHLANNSFQTSPNLRKITLTKNITSIREWPHYLFLLPWAQLTNIALPNSTIPIPILHTILGQCLCLRNASFVIGKDPPRDLLGKEVIVLKLESLVLRRYDPFPDWEAFLQPLILPLLQYIFVPDAQTWNQAAFTTLVIRSACPLESIYLAHYRNTTDDLYFFLKQVPSLRKLVLPWLHIPTSIFGAMHRREILPTLEHLECIVDRSGLNAVLDLLESYISGKPGADTANAGIQLGRFVFFCDESDLDNPLQGPLKRYYDLQPIFLENGMFIHVTIL